ncbi:DEAD/DEAH box helicase [bacterium]|nr:DEAD/DEAH box helicase [bacterium]
MARIVRFILMKITKSDIRSLVPDQIYQRGLGYYRFGHVRLMEAGVEHFKAVVSGSEDYLVEVTEEPDGWIFAECNCPYWDDCKHIVAAMLAAKDYYDRDGHMHAHPLGTPDWKYYLSQIERKTERTASKPKSQLIYTLELQPTEFIIRPQKVALKKDGSFGALRNLGYGDYSDNQIARSKNDNLVLSYLEKFENSRSVYFGYYERTGSYSFKYGDKIGVMFDLIQESQVYFRKGSSVGAVIRFSEEPAGLEFRLAEATDGIRLYPYLMFENGERQLDADYTVLSSDPIWILHQDRLYQINGLQDATYLLPFARQLYDVSIPQEELPEFLDAITKQTDLFENFRLPEGARKETVGEISEKRLYLQEFDDAIETKLKFCYRDVEVDLMDGRQTLWGSASESNTFYKVIRDEAQEKTALQELLATSVKAKHDGTIVTRKNKTWLWLMEDIPKLIAQGFVVFGEKELRRYKVNRSTPQVRVAVASGIDWFDLKMDIDFDGMQLPLKELRKAIRLKSSYVKLSDGSRAKLPAEWLGRFRHMINLSANAGDRLKLSHVHVTLIDELFTEASHRDFDQGYIERLKRLQEFDGLEEVDQPQSLNGTLRPYQNTGLSWLHFLNKYGFGGCLADDMGLGKTVQALALLLSLQTNGSYKPSLVVTPTSVVFNWLNEIQRFAPSLRTVNLTGSDRPRTKKKYDDCDIVITSYGTLRRDIIFLKDIHFNYVILDESQYIKNPNSQTAKAAKLLKATNRLALTGTPVENTTIELWSLFSFLNPGLLGNLNYFKGAFAKPIEQNREQETAELLRKLVFPFVLRRNKEEVEKDLPPKVENTIYCDMSAAQEKLYKKWRDYYRVALLKQIGEVGLNKSRMNVLEGLTRLRQIACHPSLIEDPFQGKVGKFEVTKEYIEEILAEDHKVLVFSQFVKMLTILRKDLDAANTPYAYLDGKTRDRKSCVGRFQEDDECKIFLISLRAGGTGLNLTAADYVIHYDPWWNPAVEAQATDRSHRIGQNKHVFVYKMITKETVEEKILELQARKKELVSNIITTDSAVFKRLTVEDIEVLFS